MNLYTGVVENRLDPLKLGRCQVRIVGLHTEDKTSLPTEDLPWAYPMQPITSAGINGIGWTPTGPVHGSWVVLMFRDNDEQQPIMLGTIGGIPQSQAAQFAVEDSSDAILVTDGGVLTDADGNAVKSGDGIPITVGTAEAQNKPPTGAPNTTKQPDLTEQKVPNKPSDAALNSSIKTDPPPGSTANIAAAKSNIQHLIDACDKVGLTSKYAKCAILGICGGESAWLPIEEGSYYSKAESLAAIFKRTFPSPADAQPYVKWQGSKSEFFRKIYSPEGNGKLVGHKDPEDGAKYYGRGFNQITGKSLYKQLQDYLGKKGIVVDFINNPKSLIDDPATSALATAAFYALNVKTDQNDPGYFVAALKRTGADANGTGYAKKKKYYEYFLGESVTTESTNKPTADSSKTYTKDEVKDLPPAKQSALLEDRSSNKVIGFTDPNGKYPLRNLLDEPDTNRLARSVQKETAIEFKDSVRTKTIPIANDSGTFEQPLSPFGGLYPYAKLYESESGHLLTIDDTPNNETYGIYHRAGTFIDIDANGTQVNKIIGDGYVIMDRNGAIYIAGKANVTVGNSVNVYVKGTADIQVDGAATINLKNNADIGVGGDLNIAVGGDIQVQAGGNINMKAGKAFGLDTAEATTIKSATVISVSAAETVGVVSGTDMFMQAGGEQNIKAAGNVNVDGAEFHGQEGSAGDAPEVESLVVSLTAPEYETGSSDQFATYLTTPVRPSPPVSVKTEINDQNTALTEDYQKDPSKYANPAAAADGVKQNYPGTPADDGQGQSLIAGGTSADIFLFLQKQLELTKGSGYWRETGQNGNPSNPNITRIWADLGFKGKMWETDQTAWCMGFVNWTLKQCGYRYVQSASAKEIGSNPQRWGATKVSVADAQPGDIVLWSYSHVNFVYTADNGKLTFVGGNQSPVIKGNNPNDGDLTNSWPNGWTSSRGNIVGIFRPSKS